MPLPPSCHRRSWWRLTIPLACYYFLLSSQVVVQGLQPPSTRPSPQRLGSTAVATTITTPTLPDIVSIQVCRHKNCCKKSPDLLQSVANLLGNDRVEESGCLAQCEKGPNVQVQFSLSSSSLASSSSSPPLILHEMNDATTAAIQLELVTASNAAVATTTTTTHEAEQLPKLLKAAAKVLERVMSGTSGTRSNPNMTPQQQQGKYYAIQFNSMSSRQNSNNNNTSKMAPFYRVADTNLHIYHFVIGATWCLQ